MCSSLAAQRALGTPRVPDRSMRGVDGIGEVSPRGKLKKGTFKLM